MAGEKNTLNVSEHFIKAAIMGIGVSLVIVILIHLMPVQWSILYDNFTGYGNSTVGSSSYSCSLGSSHFHNFTGQNIKVGNQTRDFGMIVGDSFDGHGLFIFVTGLVITLIIYLSKKVDVKIVKD